MTKIFNYSKPAALEGEQTTPYSFTLNDTEIICVDSIDGLTLLEAVSSMENEDPGKMAAGILNVLQVIIVGDEWPKFQNITKAPGSGVGVEQLGEIVGELMEHYMGSALPTASA